MVKSNGNAICPTQYSFETRFKLELYRIPAPAEIRPFWESGSGSGSGKIWPDFGRIFDRIWAEFASVQCVAHLRNKPPLQTVICIIDLWLSTRPTCITAQAHNTNQHDSITIQLCNVTTEINLTLSHFKIFKANKTTSCLRLKIMYASSERCVQRPYFNSLWAI